MKRYKYDQTRQEKSRTNTHDDVNSKVIGASISSTACASTPAVAAAISSDMVTKTTDVSVTISPVVHLSDYENSEGNSFNHNDEMSEPSCGEASADSSNDVTRRESTGKCKREKKMKASTAVAGLKGRKRSDCWNNFEEVKVPSSVKPGETEMKAKCKFCFSLYGYKPRGATSHLGKHMKKCTTYLNKLAKKRSQALLNYSADKGDSNLPLIVTPSEYNHDETHKIIAKIIIVHEYPFRMVEHTWFNIVLWYLNPAYQFIGRKTIRGDCLKVFHSEKESLIKSLRSVEMISLTCDLWTSNQNLCYMAVVTHYIDRNWSMQCRVLNFMELDPPHTGNVIGQDIFECLAEWKIEGKIITITLDNASNNDVALQNLKAKLSATRLSVFNAIYFHVCCCAHIINLIVNDGRQPLAPLTKNIRDTVKYIKESPSRMHKFVQICRSLSIEMGPELKLDVSTRWSSTYHMLRTCIAYRGALVSYADTDFNYAW
uniref:BED-type domain-containing protein n=1 Tax=Oryza brachyantha TaxID=4533 RepID=J3KUK2_ORYBR